MNTLEFNDIDMNDMTNKDLLGILKNGAMLDDEKRHLVATHLMSNAIGRDENVRDTLEQMKQYGEVLSTGYPELDEELQGGLGIGLTVLAAPPGRGKSTLALQLAEQFSHSGKKTVYVCNDMSKEELVAKSISRHSSDLFMKEGFTTRDILRRVDELNGMSFFEASVDDFKAHTQNLIIETGEGARKLEELKVMIAAYGYAMPESDSLVFVIDYLQNISIAERRTDKERLDIIVRDLKELAMECGVYIMVISSVGREYYNNCIIMKSMKESGGIEYAADVILALQFEGVHKENFKVSDERKKEKQQMELYVLKNRLGEADKQIPVTFTPKFNKFEFRVSERETSVSKKKFKKTILE